jgi:hypothetical protein
MEVVFAGHGTDFIDDTGTPPRKTRGSTSSSSGSFHSVVHMT